GRVPSGRHPFADRPGTSQDQSHRPGDARQTVRRRAGPLPSPRPSRGLVLRGRAGHGVYRLPGGERWPYRRWAGRDVRPGRLGSSGAWDGEAAYLLSPLAKGDLFSGGAAGLGEEGRTLLRESLLKAVAGLQAATPFTEIVLSGRLLEQEPELAAAVAADLLRVGHVTHLSGLSGAWVKQAAQGAALLADGLAGGRHEPLAASLTLRAAPGNILDWLRHPRADAVRSLL